MLQKLNRLSPYLLILMALFLAYLPAWSSQTPMDPDAFIILPTLLWIKSVGEYLDRLIELTTVDVQPVRDLSLYVDLIAMKYFGLKTFVFHNLILWFAGFFLLKKLVEFEFPTLKRIEILLILSCFTLYPLFANILSWGMARKHILSFLFCILATFEWLKLVEKNEYSRKKYFLISIYYLISILAQPINLLWPFWAIAQTNKGAFKSHFKILIPSFISFLLVAAANYAYYTSSPLYKNNYDPKHDELFSIADALLAGSHYVSKLFLPYYSSFHSTLGDYTVVSGFIISTIIITMYSFLFKGSGFARKWGLFAIMPMFIILQKPSYLYDTYLMIPSISALLFFIHIKEKSPKLHYKNFLYGGLILTWSIISFNESKLWSDKVSLYQVSFKRTPSCWSAAKLLLSNFERNSLVGTDEAKDYLYSHDCGRFQMGGKPLQVLKVWLLYYDESLPREMRLSRLDRISVLAPLADFMSTALVIKMEKHTEAEARINKLIAKYSDVNPESLNIVKDVIYPYCIKRQLQDCLKMLEPFARPFEF